MDRPVIIVTSMNDSIFRQTGWRMLSTLREMMPPTVQMICLHELEGEGALAEMIATGPAGLYPHLNRTVPWLDRMKAREDATARGMATGVYDFRRDAVKFGHKVAAFCAGVRFVLKANATRPEGVPAPLLVWADADVLAHRPIPMDWLQGLLPAGKAIGWLDRQNLYPECGWVMVDTAHRAVPPIFAEFEADYASGTFRRHREWHDSWVLWRIVQAWEEANGTAITHSLSGGWAHHSHPFANGPLSAYLDHAKGPRKAGGRTPARERAARDDIPHWQGA